MSFNRKKQNNIRNKEERQAEIKPILLKLSELHLKPTTSDAIKTLYIKIQAYIQEGERSELNIPFPEYNSNIVGVLATDVKERTVVKIEHIKL
jgi:hypothetical protein